MSRANTPRRSHFAQSLDILYGRERYQYCHAHVLAEEGRFAEAAEAFEAIGDFEDAPLRSQYCLGRDAEANARYDEALFAYEAAITIDDAEDRLYNLRGQIYNRAIALKQEGDYQTAIDLFMLLGDYLSSADQAVECKTYLRDAEYDQADALEASGDLQGAYDLFSSPCPATATRRSAPKISRRSWASNNLIFFPGG